MPVWNSKKEELNQQENINKKKLLYDGHGTGTDKRLLHMIKEITKFCLVEEPLEQIQHSHSQVVQAISQCISDAEKNEKMLEVCRKDLSIACAAVEEEEYAIRQAKSEIDKAKLDLEYEIKVQVVNELPNCQMTESRIKSLEEKRLSLLNRMEKHKQQLQKIVSVCDEFEKIIADDTEQEASNNSASNSFESMNVDL